MQSYSNDASLLIPTSGLDTHYRVLGWPTANPIELGGFDIEGIPDRSFVTIVGVEASTTVRVTAGGPIVADRYGLDLGPAEVGEVIGAACQAVTCPVDDGAHTLEADLPVGIMVYGYYDVGSYGYAGGSDLEQIHPLI